MKRKSAKEQSDYVDAILSGHVTKKPWIGLTPSETEIFNTWLSGAGAAEAIEQAIREERGWCHQIVWDYGYSRVDNKDVQEACKILTKRILARGKK